VTSTGATDLDQDLAWSRLGNGNLAELGRLLRCDELKCFHDCLTSL
jgi:hypothetical protein